MLSAADILLFVSRANDLLDKDSVNVLNQKFKSFPDTPMWYVVTCAYTYATPLTVHGMPDETEFQKDLSAAKEKLQQRPCSDSEERRARDSVAGRVTFIPNTNTFLVDSTTGYGTRALLDKILATFDNRAARNAKRDRLAQAIHAAQDGLLEILGRAITHVAAVNRTIDIAYRKSIQPEIEKFVATGLAAEIAQVSQALRAHVDEVRRDTELVYVEPVPAIAYATESAQVTILKSELDNMRDQRQSRSYAYLSSNMPLDPNLISGRMDSIRLTAVDSLSRRLDELWADRDAKGLLDVSPSIDQVLEAVMDKEVYLADERVTAEAQRRHRLLLDYLRIPAERLLGLYTSADLRNTIFSRQNTLLTAMERDLPRTCEELQLKLRDAHESRREPELTARHSLPQSLRPGLPPSPTPLHRSCTIASTFPPKSPYFLFWAKLSWLAFRCQIANRPEES